MSTFTAIVEYWHEGDQNYRMETFKRPTRLSAMYVARKALRTGFDRPGYMPECARIEDADGKVVAAYEIDGDGQVKPKPFGNCGL